jgi:hypothetical protein
MRSKIMGFMKNAYDIVAARESRLISADVRHFAKPNGVSGSFEPTPQTALLDEDTDWDLPEGLEEMTAISPGGGFGGIRHAQLSDKFDGVVVKRLSAVEADPKKSHQHEFNGSVPLRRLLGQCDRKNIPAQFVRVDGMSESATVNGELSWYDARRKHPTRTEYRLYYSSNEVTSSMKEGDIFYLALIRDGSALVIATEPDNPINDQLFWLFGLENKPSSTFTYQAITAGRVLKWASAKSSSGGD